MNDYHIKNKNIYYFYIKNYVYHEQINIVKIICNNMEGYTYFTIYKYTLHIYDGLCTRRDVYGTRTIRFNTENWKVHFFRQHIYLRYSRLRCFFAHSFLSINIIDLRSNYFLSKICEICSFYGAWQIRRIRKDSFGVCSMHTKFVIFSMYA